MSREFLRRLRIKTYLKDARANRKENTCGSLRLRLHKPHVANLTAAQFTFYLPQKDGSQAWMEVKLVRSGDRTRTSCTHE